MIRLVYVSARRTIAGLITWVRKRSAVDTEDHFCESLCDTALDLWKRTADGAAEDGLERC